MRSPTVAGGGARTRTVAGPAAGHGRRAAVGVLVVAVFAGTVAASNWLTSRYGFISVGLGLLATAGTYAAGGCLLARDWVHDTAGRAVVLAATTAGGVASAVMAGPRLAAASAASAAAFVLSELADLLVYQPLRRHGFIRTVVASNAVGAPTRSCSSPWPGSRSGRRSPAGSWPRPPRPPFRSPWCWSPMRYYATASGPKVREAMRCGALGQIVTPGSGNRVHTGVDWCADNSAYTGSFPGDDRYLACPSARSLHARRCSFATAPDVVADAAATLARSISMLARIRAAGFPAALVAQDGLQHLAVPWGEFDALFIGGSTTWKLGPAAADLPAQARRRGLWVHMGRVNSLRRLRYAQRIGCHSAAGTHLAYGPDRKLPELRRWPSVVNACSHGTGGYGDA